MEGTLQITGAPASPHSLRAPSWVYDLCGNEALYLHPDLPPVVEGRVVLTAGAGSVRAVTITNLTLETLEVPLP
jgi:hypothetical protein